MSRIKIIVVVCLFAVGGAALLIAVRAQNVSVSLSDLTAQGNAAITTDATANNGSFLAFGASQVGSTADTFIPSSLEDWEPLPKLTYQATGQTRYVTPNGSDSGEGASEASPISLSRATAIAQAGDVIYLAPGTYSQRMVIDGLKGTAEMPIVFTAKHEDQGNVIVRHGSGQIAHVINSSHVTVDGIVFDGADSAIWGFLSGAAVGTGPVINDNITLRNGVVRDVAREAGVVIRQADTFILEGTLIENVFNGTVNDPGNGEGVYVGCGSCSWMLHEERNIIVRRNKITNVGGEGIEFKAGARNIIIEDNLVTNSGFRLLTGGGNCCFGGGITVHPIGATTAPNFDTNAMVRRNRVGNISNVGYVIGAGNTTTDANLAWQTGVRHARGKETAARAPFISLQLFFGVYDQLSFTNNHSFDITHNNLFESSGSYGQPTQQQPVILSQEITDHANEAAAFSAWLADAYR